MEVYKAFKYRIYPTPEQENLIQRTFGCCRFVYNYFLEAQKSAYALNGSHLTKFDCFKALTALKREKPWLSEVPLNALRASIEDLDAAYKAFFRGKGKVGFPRFKSRYDHNKAFRFDNSDETTRIEGNCIRFPKLGEVQAVFDRLPSGPIKKAAIRQMPSEKYFAILTCKVEIDPLPVCDTAIGVDVGLKDYATLSTGEHIPNPKYLSKYLKKLRREQRRLSRKKKGSNNWNKQRVKVARAYERVTNCRKNFQHNLSHRLVNSAQIICTENLNIKSMVQNHRLARAVADAAWYEFIRQLEYKAAWVGRVVQKVDTFFPSSQTCHICGFRNSITKDLSVRNWFCPQCGAAHDRDENAAQTILQEGLRLLSMEYVPDEE